MKCNLNFDESLTLALEPMSEIVVFEDKDDISPRFKKHGMPGDRRLGITAEYVKYLRDMEEIERIRDGARATGLDEKFGEVLADTGITDLSSINFVEASRIREALGQSGLSAEIEDLTHDMTKKEASKIMPSNIDIRLKQAIDILSDDLSDDAKGQAKLQQLLSPKTPESVMTRDARFTWREGGKIHKYDFSFSKPLIEQVNFIYDLIKRLGYGDLLSKFSKTLKARQTLLKYVRPDMSETQTLRTAMLYTIRNIAVEISDRSTKAQPKAPAAPTVAPVQPKPSGPDPDFPGLAGLRSK